MIDDPNDKEDLDAIIHDLGSRGFTIDEAVAYLRYCEHVDPTVDEYAGIRGMAKVQALVNQRQAKALEQTQKVQSRMSDIRAVAAFCRGKVK